MFKKLHSWIKLSYSYFFYFLQISIVNNADSHQICRVLSFEKVEHFVFQIFVWFRVDVESFTSSGGEVTEGMSGVGRGSLDLQ